MKYRIETLQQIGNIVTEDNIDDLAISLYDWMRHVVEIRKKIKETSPSIDSSILFSELAAVGFIWTDDGNNEITGVNIHMGETGEVKEIVFNKRPNNIENCDEGGEGIVIKT